MARRTRNLLDYKEHSRLPDLVHAVIRDAYVEYTYSGNKVTSEIYWTDSGKTTKIREHTYTYTGSPFDAKPSTIQWRLNEVGRSVFEAREKL